MKLTYFILPFPLQSWFCFFQLSLSHGTTRTLTAESPKLLAMLCMIQIKKKNSLSKRFNLKYSPNIRQIHKVPSRAQESMQRDCIKASWDGYSLTAHSCLFLPWKGERNTTKKNFPPLSILSFYSSCERDKKIPIPYQQTPQHCTRGRGDVAPLQ